MTRKELIKKHGWVKYLYANIRTMSGVSFWALWWWRLTPKRIRHYILATEALERYENKHGVVTEEEYQAALKFIEE